MSENDQDFPQAVMDELNRHLAVSMRARNTAPDPEMGGLSPEQVTGLIYSDWGEPGGAVQVNTDVPLPELGTSNFFRETRAFLQALHDAGGVRATASKNLPRRFVADVLPLMGGEEAVAEAWKYNKVVNKQDVPRLHIARVVAQAAGLTRLYKGKFVVPKAKAALLRDDRAGELFACLFVAFFRRFNLAYSHRVVFEARGLQTCVGYTLYRLGVVARDWRPVEDLPAEVLLPAVRDEIEMEISGSEYWTTDKLLTSRLIWPLLDWGLLEGRHEQDSRLRTAILTAARITPLYEACLRFDLGVTT